MFYFSFLISSFGILYVYPQNIAEITETSSEANITLSSLMPVEDSAFGKSGQVRYDRDTKSNCNFKENYYLVAMVKLPRYHYSCTGSLIAPRWTLSAKECFTSGHIIPDNVMIEVQFSKENSVRYASSNAFQSMRKMKKYFGDTYISLILLETPVDEIEDVYFGKLVYGELPEDLSTECDPNNFTLTYWPSRGRHATFTYASAGLHCITQHYIPNSSCKWLDKNRMCTNGPKPEIARCTELIGAPLICDGYQYGVAINNDNCNKENVINYARVDRYLRFISETMKNATDAENKQNQILPYLWIYILTSVPPLQMLNWIMNAH